MSRLSAGSTVLLDLGGFIVTEDDNVPPGTYPVDGQELLFTPENLEVICQAVLSDLVSEQPAVATLDGAAISGVQVSTGCSRFAFTRTIRLASGRSRRHSVTPGSWAAGSLRVERFSSPSLPGPHTIVVNLTGFAEGPSIITYRIDVR